MSLHAVCFNKSGNRIELGPLLFDLFCSWKAGLILDVLRHYFKRDLLFACLGCLVG